MNKFIAACLLFLSVSASAFTGTDKQVQVIIPFQAGGTVDAIFREVQLYANSRGISMLPSYRPGAQGVIGLRELRTLPADGYSMAITTLDSVAEYDLFTGTAWDTDDIIYLHQSIMGIVMKNSPKASLSDMLNEMNRKLKSPAGASFGYSTPIQQVTLKNMLSNPDDNYVLVNYGKSGLTIITDLGSGSLDVGIGSLATYAPHIQSGRLKLLATDSPVTLQAYPDTPTLKSLYPSMPDIVRGTAMVLQSNNPEANAFWRKFMADYQNTTRFRARAMVDFYQIRKVVPGDIQRALNIQKELLRAKAE